MLFKKRHKTEKSSTAMDRLAGKIARFGIRFQETFAYNMNKKIAGISPTRMKVLLILFCLFWGGLSICFVASAFFGSRQHVINIDTINIPKHIEKGNKKETGARVDADIYEQIQAYKKYVDSAHLEISPGLLDTMKTLEKIYLSQQKNEEHEK